MKNIFKIIIALFFAGLIFSCNPGGVVTTSDDAAKDLVSLRSLLSGIDASLGLLADEKQESKVLSRAITPSDADSTLTGDPADIYSQFNGTGSNEVRVPSSVYFQDYYNSGDEAYFTMEPEGEYYRIILYIYPSVNFDIKYNYEEYLVAPNDWTNMNDDFVSGKLSKYKTYFSDGSVAERTIEFTSADSDSAGYYNNEALIGAVSDEILESGNYDYPDPITDPATSSTGSWSSKTNSTIATRSGSDISAVEYYTEGDNTYSGVTYISTEQTFLWATQSKTVVRFSGDFSDNTSKERSLTTIGNVGSIWYTETNEIDIHTSSDRIVYDKVLKLWYDNPDSAKSRTSDYQQNLHLVGSDVNTNQYRENY